LRNRDFVLLLVAGLAALAVYLFVSAPPPLAEKGPEPGARMPVESLLAMAQGENAVMRKLWTEEIVGEGKKRGLAFNERWKETGVAAGPLPALFLRETALRLEKTPARLSLFLGSDAPINAANRFDEDQARRFAALKATGKPQFFFSPDVDRRTALFPDVAVAKACVECHNAHPKSPKRDWKPGDVMGATTWLYPDETVAHDEAVRVLGSLRKCMRDTYAAYLKKAAGFRKPPVVGDRWPRDGLFLPSVDVFMAEFERRASPATVRALIEASQK
jgi:hypothetical protein